MATININGKEITIGAPGQDGFTQNNGVGGWYTWEGVDASEFHITPSTANPGVTIVLEGGQFVKAPAGYKAALYDAANGAGTGVVPGTRYNGVLVTNFQIPQPAKFTEYRAGYGEWIFADYGQIGVAAATVPLVTPAIPPANTPKPTVPPVSGPPVKLTDIVQLSSTSVERQYVKGTLKAIDTQIITVTNTSNNVEVNAAFSPRAGLVFDPTTVLVPANSNRQVKLTFDIATIDALNEGLTAYNIPIALTSPTAIMPAPIPAPPPPPPPQVPAPPAPPAPQPVVATVPPYVRPTIVEPTLPTPLPPTPPEPGHWEIVEVGPGSTTTTFVVTHHAPFNGQEPGERNGYVLGMYDTTYGYNKTTVVGPTYDYQLVGNVNSAGPKPVPPPPSVTITEDSDKYQLISNKLVMTMADYVASQQQALVPPPPPPPEPPPAPVEPPPQSFGGSGGGGSGAFRGGRGQTLDANGDQTNGGFDINTIAAT